MNSVVPPLLVPTPDGVPLPSASAIDRRRRRRLAQALAWSFGLHAGLVTLSQQAAFIPPPPPGAALQLRLRPATAPSPGAAASVGAAAASPPSAAAQDAERPPTPSVSGGDGADPAAPAPRGDGKAPAGAGMGVPITPGDPFDGLSVSQMRHATSVPPSARIDYQVSGATSGAAALQWEVQGGARYRLEMNGPDGQKAASSGTIGDGGIAPLEAGEEGAGARTRVQFDRAAGLLSSSASPHTYKIIDAALDPWAVLMQLVAVGRADPDRLSAPIAFFVAGAQGVAPVRFESAGREAIETGLGSVEAEHLVQVVPSGAARLEVWLAPGHQWLPVQLRAVAPDGSAVTHTAKAITLPE